MNKSPGARFHYLVWLLLTALYAPVLLQLYKSRWHTIDYTHAYFILPASLWLVWRKRKALSAVSRQGAAAAAPMAAKGLLGLDAGLYWLILGIFMFILGWRKDYLFLSTLSLIPSLSGVVYCLYGRATAKALRFPILYLLLMVPPPLGVLDAITIPMRYGASLLAYLVLRSFGFPITREGLVLSVEGQELFMGPACSGFRSLITVFSLGLAYVYISASSRKKKLVLLVSIIPLALFGNLARVLILCVVAYLFGQEAAQGFFHTFSGFVVFVIVILGLLIMEILLNRLTGARSENE